MIPLFILEEHHEAFFLWHYALRKGLMPKQGSNLLHFDEHADMNYPRFFDSIFNFPVDLCRIHDFAMTEMNIGNFIIPAAFQGIFNTICWFNHAPACSREPERIFLSTMNNEGRVFTRDAVRNNQKAVRHACFDYYKMNVEASIPVPEGPNVLDIDLDYFSCEKFPRTVNRVNVTKKEYESFANDPYHFLRLCPHHKIRALKENSKYFLEFDRFNEDIVSELKMPESTISNRIKDLVAYLKQFVSAPKIIHICRSTHSGYSPHDQVQLIEEQLLDEIGQIYSVTVQHISDI
ncbi:MAG: UPF0489 family protein [Candidatus Wallbacteria bacterium]|nr:UPF0489 family protein [Candidatus Wallbacteria bacterium]